MTQRMIVLDPLTESPLKNLSGFDSAFSHGGHDPIAVFDFDGVLCAPTEDLVYKLKETDGERSFLQKMATEHGIDHSLYDVPYLRHLVLQAILDMQGVIPEPGPMLQLALELSRKNRPFFVLTARSGRSAVNRALNFLTHHKLTPQEVFFVGRVSKGSQLSFIGQMPLRRGSIVYFDDSMRHSYNGSRQRIHSFEVVRLPWTNQNWTEAKDLLTDSLGFSKNIQLPRFAA